MNSYKANTGVEAEVQHSENFDLLVRFQRCDKMVSYCLSYTVCTFTGKLTPMTCSRKDF